MKNKGLDDEQHAILLQSYSVPQSNPYKPVVIQCEMVEIFFMPYRNILQ